MIGFEMQSDCASKQVCSLMSIKKPHWSESGVVQDKARAIFKSDFSNTVIKCECELVI